MIFVPPCSCELCVLDPLFIDVPRVGHVVAHCHIKACVLHPCSYFKMMVPPSTEPRESGIFVSIGKRAAEHGVAADIHSTSRDGFSDVCARPICEKLTIEIVVPYSSYFASGSWSMGCTHVVAASCEHVLVASLWTFTSQGICTTASEG